MSLLIIAYYLLLRAVEPLVATSNGNQQQNGCCDAHGHTCNEN